MNLALFSNIDPQTFPEQLNQCLAAHEHRITQLLQQHATHYTWDNLMRPLEAMDQELETLWAPVSHQHAVVNSPRLRTCYEACLPQLSAYESQRGQNKALFEAIQSIDTTTLTPTQRKIIDDHLLGFRLSGVALDPATQAEFRTIDARLSELSNQFENHILDATLAFELHLQDEKRLRGLPEHAMANARELAKTKSQDGWIFNLEYPCYLAVMTYAEDRELRQSMYQAFATRASDQGPNAHTFDNSPIMDEILSLRHRMAQCLGYPHYAALSLATKMAESTQHVNDFLHDLRDRAYDKAVLEMQALRDYAHEHHAMDVIEAWDMAYLSEKKHQDQFHFSQEALRPYFPLDRVLQGLFLILSRLYGMRCERLDNIDRWHPDVLCYQIMDKDHQLRGVIYLDLLARPHKRGGAWMDSCRSRYQASSGHLDLPIATLTCNFAKPVAGAKVTLSHDDVVTLFHEFGHCLQHVLTQVNDRDAAGIHGVEWDAVELPSQFFENWCWNQDALRELSAHVDTQEPLPAEKYAALIASKNFQSAMGLMRQVEFSLFDFRLHENYQPNAKNWISTVLAEVRALTCVVPLWPHQRFAHGFSHIFGGGYAAGYYSYQWANVLACDAFARFEEEGIFNAHTGHDFLHHILEVGGSRKALDAFVSFRGRMPCVDAYIHSLGL